METQGQQRPLPGAVRGLGLIRGLMGKWSTATPSMANMAIVVAKVLWFERGRYM